MMPKTGMSNIGNWLTPLLEFNISFILNALFIGNSFLHNIYKCL